MSDSPRADAPCGCDEHRICRECAYGTTQRRTESPAPAARIAPAFRAGVAIAAAQLVGAANDGRRVAAERDVCDDRSGLFYITRSRSLTAPAILAALDGEIHVYATPHFQSDEEAKRFSLAVAEHRHLTKVGILKPIIS